MKTQGTLSQTEEGKAYADRYRYLQVGIILTMLLFFCRLWYLQIIKGNELRNFSEKNRIKEGKTVAPRGLIFDRNNEVLVENLPGFEAIISPQYTDDLKTTAAAVGRILNIPSKKIISKVKKSRRFNGPFYPVRIKENLTREEVFHLKRLRIKFSGLDIRETIVRHYPIGESAAQLLGYVAEISKKQLPTMNKKYLNKIKFRQGDIIGKSGIEEAHEVHLHGKNGVKYLQIDAKGREANIYTPNIFGEYLSNREAIPGNSLVLTIDKDVQKATYETFKKHERIGSVIAMKSNGEVLAWLSSPSYDPNKFSTGISTELWSQLINDPFKPLLNKVIKEHTSPGSTFKPIVALAAIQEKLFNKNGTIRCGGLLKFGRRPYHDHVKYGHGHIGILEGIERSCNILFYKLGISLTVDRIAKYATLLGLGERTGIELEGEVPGLIPTSEWKKEVLGEVWQPGENLSNAIGQGFTLVTPIQLAAAYNTIAQEGKKYKPFLVKKIVTQEGKSIEEFEPQLLDDVSEEKEGRIHIDKSTFRFVKQGLWRVNNGEKGTARWWKIPGVEIAGKTGTSQVMSFSADQIYSKCEENPIQQRHHGWFVGYAPADNPQIVVSVLAEHACHGSTGAAPVVRDIIRSYIEKYHPEMIKRKKPRQAKNQAKQESTP